MSMENHQDDLSDSSNIPNQDGPDNDLQDFEPKSPDSFNQQFSDPPESLQDDKDSRDSNRNESLSQDSGREDEDESDKNDEIGHREVDQNTGKVTIIHRNKKKTKKKNTKKKKKHNGSEQKDSEYFPNKDMDNVNNANNRNNSNSNLNESRSQNSEREDRSSNNKKKKKPTMQILFSKQKKNKKENNVSQRSSLSYANWRLPSELSIDKQDFLNEDYAGQNEAIECDYKNKTIAITAKGIKYVFDGKNDEITIWHKGNNKKKDTIKDITTIDCKISKIPPIGSKIHKSNAKICFTNKKKKEEIPTIHTIPIKTEKLIEHLYSFEKTKKEQGIFKPGVVNRFVDHYLKNYSKLSDAELSPVGLEINCTSGKEEIKYAKFVYYMDDEKIRYFTDNDNIGKEIYNNKVVAKIAEKMVKFEIIDNDGRRILYELPISDDFIELLKQTDKDFTEESSKYIEIDFNALCDVVEMNDAPFADVNDVDLTIEEVERITDGYYKFTTNNENTYIRYSATDKTFEYMKNGKCVRTYDILSYKDAEDKNQDHHLYLSTRGYKKKQLCFSIRNEEMKSFFNKLCGKSTENQRLIKGEKLTNALKDRFKEKKPNVITNFFKKPPKGIKYITGKEITIANEGENLIFSLDEKGENKITIPIQDFLFGNLAAFTCKRKKEDPHITYYDDALVLEHKTDDPNSRSTIIIDFKQMLQEQGLDAGRYTGLDDMKSFLIRIKAAEKKQQARRRSQQPDDDDYFFAVENDIISTIYNNGENIEKAAAYMHLNDYINEYADQEMTEDEINFFIDIFGSLNNINELAYKIGAQIQENIQEDKNVDFNKIFIALICIAEPEQVQAFTNVFIEKYKKLQNIQQEGDNWPEINALIAYGFITNDQNQEFNQSVTDYTNQAHQSNTNDIQNNALEIPSIITDIVFCKKRRKINNGPIEKKNLNIVQKFGKKISKGIKSIFSRR